MELVFLGTGAAWGVPEHACECAICKEMRSRGEERTRSSLAIEAASTFLIDCGPDFRAQAIRNGLKKPDAVFITHGHGDHFLGLDDLLAYKRSAAEDQWAPIPVFATSNTWSAMEKRFDYLIGGLIQKREIRPEAPVEGPDYRVIPFGVRHGSTAKGAVGYYLEVGEEGAKTTLIYTSDFSSVMGEPDFLTGADILVIQAHWLNEPVFNRPNHMSLQMALPYIRKWSPKKAVYIIHLSDADQVPGDPCNHYMKKIEPAGPMTNPESGGPYPVPLCQQNWDELLERIRRDFDINVPLLAPFDGMRVIL